jgi:hypothetical protein
MLYRIRLDTAWARVGALVEDRYLFAVARPINLTTEQLIGDLRGWLALHTLPVFSGESLYCECPEVKNAKLLF